MDRCFRGKGRDGKVQRLGVVAALAWLGVAHAREPGPAPYVDPQGRFQLALPRGWELLQPGSGPPEVLLAARGSAGQVLVIVRVPGPTQEARATTDELGSVVAAAAAERGYELVSARRRTVGERKLPALDARLRSKGNDGPASAYARFLFYSGSTLAALVEARPDARDDQAARRVVESFKPLSQ